jgi:hypothetical protein
MVGSALIAELGVSVHRLRERQLKLLMELIKALAHRDPLARQGNVSRNDLS